jgi:hypothetical protein
MIIGARGTTPCQHRAKPEAEIETVSHLPFGPRGSSNGPAQLGAGMNLGSNHGAPGNHGLAIERVGIWR